MRLGVCWYPEQWPEETWADDVALMAATGLRVVRIGEFAWSRMEPRPGVVDLGWLDRAIDLVAGAGMEVVLGTPTATPPRWLLRAEPSILSVGADGRRRAPGSRRHTCPTNRTYLDHARRITTVLADRYADHPAVTAWQIDNEPGNHDSTRCWCDDCRAAFTTWLRARFDDDVDALNTAWGTVFWSQTYDDLADVDLPVPTMTRQNPALDLAHLRFASDQVVAGLAEQHDVLAARGATTFTNLYLGDVDVDGGAVGRLHGLGAIDSYPHGVSGPDEVAFLLDLARGTSLQPGEGRDARGGRGWVVEQQPGAVNWTGGNPAVPPGQVRLWGWQAALHGIDTLLFFRWRAATAGQEQYHTGLLRHDRTPDQGLAEARRLADEFAAADDGLLHRPVARVALVHAHADAWAIDLDPHRDGLTHRSLVLAAHTAARRLGLDVDIVPDDAELTGYDVVLCPALHLATPERQRALNHAADAGTEVVVGVRSLVATPENGWVDVALPAGLTDRLGARVTEWGTAADQWGEVPRFELGGDLSPSGEWADTFDVLADDVEVVATWQGTHRDGRPAAVRRGCVTALGASSVEAWTSTLATLLRLPVGSPGTTVHHRGRATVTMDHRTCTTTSLPGDEPTS